MHAPWDEDESSPACPRGPRLQSTLIIELRALERGPLDRTLEISLSVIFPLSIRSNGGESVVSKKKCIEKNIHQNIIIFSILPYSFCDELNFETGKTNLVVSSTNFSTRKISNIQIWEETRSRKIPKGGDEERRLKNLIYLCIFEPSQRGNLKRVNIQLVSLPKTR